MTRMGKLLRVSLMVAAFVVLATVVFGCGDAAGCWNHIKNRATTCEQMRLDEAERDR